MLQNIIEQEDFIKGLPDASLYGEMEQPSGQLPQFLVLSEIQRRTDMRERYEATQEQPQGTISEQIVAEGLGGTPQQAPSMSPMGLASQTMGSPIPTDPASQASVVAATGAPPPPTGGMAIGASGLGGMGAPPQMTAGGGRVGYQEGGDVTLEEIQRRNRANEEYMRTRPTEHITLDGEVLSFPGGVPTAAETRRRYQTDAENTQEERVLAAQGEFFNRARKGEGVGSDNPALKDLYRIREEGTYDPESEEYLNTRPIPALINKYGASMVIGFLEGEKRLREEGKHIAPEYADAYQQTKDNFYSNYPQEFLEEVYETRGGPIDISEEVSMASGGIIGMSNGGAAFGPEYHALQEQRREVAPYMNPFSGSYSPAVSSAAQTMVGQSQEAYRGALGKEARIRKEEERLREIEAIERFGGVVPEELKDTYLLEGDIEIEYGEGTPLPEELLRPLEDVGNIADIVADMTGEEIGTEYTGTATRPIGGGDPDLVGTDTAADADSFQFEEVLNEFETAQEEGGEELTSAYAGISDAIGVDAADQRKLPGTLDRSGVTDALTALVEGGAERLEARRGSTEELINQIREEGRRDAFSAAMMQLGAGVAGGDMSGGLQRAGEAATSINALARDAARAEGRGLRDYEEAALAQADEFGLKSATFEYEEGRDEAIRGEEIRQWEETYGLQAHVAETDRLMKEAAHDLSAAELRSLNVNRAHTLEAAAEKIAFDITKEEGIDLRAATTSFENYMETIQEQAEDMGAAFLPEAKLEFIKANQLMILKALRPRLSDEFYSAFINALEGEGGGPPSATASLSDEKYRM